MRGGVRAGNQPLSSLADHFRVSDPHFLRFGRRGSIAFLLIGCLLIVAWQAHVAADPRSRDANYELIGFRGAYSGKIQKYFYFFYYTGKFPISTRRKVHKLKWNEAAARRALEQTREVLPQREPGSDRVRQPGRLPTLFMEDGAFLRTGDFGKIYLLFADAWLNGTPKRAKFLGFNRLLGIGSLLAVFLALSVLDHRLLGSLLVLLLGSNPFQIMELYHTNNVFGYPIPVASLMLALHAAFIFGRTRHRTVYLLPIVSGVFLASFREVRLEPALVLLSIAVLYATASGGWRLRAGLLATLGVTALSTSLLWGYYWNAKFEEAFEIVERQGGVSFDPPWPRSHALWHSAWMGLGDFAAERGYRYRDRTAYAWGISEVNRRFGTRYRMTGGWELENYRTAQRKHRMRPEELDLYLTVMRDRILDDIADDPLWYAGVIARRVAAVFQYTTPVRLGTGRLRFDVPFSAWLLFPVLGWLIYLRRWDQLKLLGFYLPTSLSCILVYAGFTMTFNSAFHLVLFAVFVCWAANAASALLARRVAE